MMTPTNSKKVEVKPTFSDIVELVRTEYRDGFGIEIGYAKAAGLLDEAIKPQLTQALKELKDESVEYELNMHGIYDKDLSDTVNAVPIEAIDDKIKEFERI